MRPHCPGVEVERGACYPCGYAQTRRPSGRIPGRGTTSGVTVDLPAFDVVDLMHTLTVTMPRYPGDPAVAITAVEQTGEDAPLVHQMTFGDHAGTQNVT